MSTERIVDQLRRRVPKPVKRLARFAVNYPGIYVRLRANYDYDARRFLRFSSVNGRQGSAGNVRAWIDADVHKIEKALALKTPRPGFGKPVVRRLVDNLHSYLDHSEADLSVELAVNALAAYEEFNARHGVSDDQLASEIRSVRDRTAEGCDGGRGGTRDITRRDIHACAKIDLEPFLLSRHSIRQFSDEEVSPELIERAVKMAQRTPSVCNRQATRVHVFSDPTDRARVLSCQLGNAGFGEQIKVALVITVDLETFFSVGERNQGWIDGGMFAMSLIYALHSLGLGTCPLNWCAEKERDEHLHRVAAIPDSEMVIMQIAVGHLPDTLKVAQSARKPLSRVLIAGAQTREVRAPKGA